MQFYHVQQQTQTKFKWTLAFITVVNVSDGDSYSTNFHVNLSQLAAVAALCVQYEADFRPNMTIVVKALQPLLNSSKPPGAESQPPPRP